MGRSLSTEPSIQPSFGVGSQGTSRPVFPSLAMRDAAEKTNGTEHDAHLLLLVCHVSGNQSLDGTHTADQIITSGAVT